MPNSAMLSQAARAAEGIPQDLPSYADQPAGGAGGSALPDILAALKGGQVSAQSLMQLLAMLLQSGQLPGGGAGAGPQGMTPEDMAAMMGGQGGQSPIEAAYLGQQ